MGVIYSARCAEFACSCRVHRSDVPYTDGERVPHGGSYYDHNGLSVGVTCDGRVVSVMGREEHEIQAAISRVRASK